jgi:hypothetical protein
VSEHPEWQEKIAALLWAAAMGAAVRIGRPIQKLDHDVLERGALVGAREAAQLHDGLDLLGEDATSVRGFHLGGQEGVNDLLFVGARPQPFDIISHHWAAGLAIAARTKFFASSRSQPECSRQKMTAKSNARK